MPTISTPAYLLDQAKRRLTPTPVTIPGMGTIEKRLLERKWNQFPMAPAPADSGLKTVMGDSGLPVFGHMIEMFRGGPDFLLHLYRAAVERALPLHASRIVRRGTDITLVGHGAMVTTLLQAAALAESEGTSCEVVDVRSLSPVDYGPILDSVRRTGRMVYAQEAPQFTSLGSEIAATVMEKAFFALESPVLRVSGFDTPFPPAKLEGTYLPDADRILEAVDRALAY